MNTLQRKENEGREALRNGGAEEGASDQDHHRPGAAHAAAGIAAGGNTGAGTRGQPRTPASQRAGCEAHKSGSVRGAPGRPGAPTRPMSEHGATVGTRRRSCAGVARRAALAGSYGDLRG